jgi:hypothetical protein
MWVFALLALTTSQADAWIDRLRSDKVEEREEAGRRLLELEAAAIPALEKAAAAGDAEIRGRANDLLAEIARRGRVRSFRPPSIRLTLKVEDEPFYTAARKVFEPFGLTRFNLQDDLKDRRVTLALESATLWEAYESFCRAGGARIPTRIFHRSVPIGRLDFQDEADDRSPVFRADSGDVRIVAELDRARKAEGGTATNWIFLHGWHPPGHWANPIGVEGLRLTDELGRVIACSSSTGTTERAEGLLTRSGIFNTRIPSESLRQAASLQLRGTLVLSYPQDVDRTEIALAGLDLPRTLRFGESRFKITQARYNGAEWSFAFDVSCGPNGLTLLTQLEDREGRWITDALHDRTGPRSVGGGSYNRRVPEGRVPARLVVCRILGEDQVRIPFAFSGLPVPPLTPEG